MALTNMKLANKKATLLSDDIAEASPDRPEYPYGLQIGLDNESLDKLGLSTLPEVGAEVDITARAVVQTVRVENYQNGKTERRVDLQITDLDVQTGDGSSAQRMYSESGMAK
jgi:hypothetical protein